MNQVYMEIEIPQKEFKKMKQAKIEENQQKQRRKRVKFAGNKCREKMETR